ncbi:Uncharacterised protein [Bordetella pertussis]|nr:Uncharacterised protein [Bordetella pertussis]
MILVHHQIALRALRKRQRRVMLGVEGSRVGEIRHIQSDVVARIHAPGVLQLGAVDDMDVVPGYDLARIAQVRRLQRGVVAGGHGSAIVDTLGLHREIVACLQAAPVVRLPARRDRQIMLGVENPAIAELFRLDDDVLVGLHLAFVIESSARGNSDILAGRERAGIGNAGGNDRGGLLDLHLARVARGPGSRQRGALGHDLGPGLVVERRRRYGHALAHFQIAGIGHRAAGVDLQRPHQANLVGETGVVPRGQVRGASALGDLRRQRDGVGRDGVIALYRNLAVLGIAPGHRDLRAALLDIQASRVVPACHVDAQLVRAGRRLCAGGDGRRPAALAGDLHLAFGGHDAVVHDGLGSLDHQGAGRARRSLALEGAPVLDALRLDALGAVRADQELVRQGAAHLEHALLAGRDVALVDQVASRAHGDAGAILLVAAVADTAGMADQLAGLDHDRTAIGHERGVGHNRFVLTRFARDRVGDLRTSVHDVDLAPGHGFVVVVDGPQRTIEKQLLRDLHRHRRLALVPFGSQHALADLALDGGMLEHGRIGRYGDRPVLGQGIVAQQQGAVLRIHDDVALGQHALMRIAAPDRDIALGADHHAAGREEILPQRAARPPWRGGLDSACLQRADADRTGAVDACPASAGSVHGDALARELQRPCDFRRRQAEGPAGGGLKAAIALNRPELQLLLRARLQIAGRVDDTQRHGAPRLQIGACIAHQLRNAHVSRAIDVHRPYGGQRAQVQVLAALHMQRAASLGRLQRHAGASVQGQRAARLHGAQIELAAARHMQTAPAGGGRYAHRILAADPNVAIGVQRVRRHRGSAAHVDRTGGLHRAQRGAAFRPQRNVGKTAGLIDPDRIAPGHADRAVGTEGVRSDRAPAFEPDTALGGNLAYIQRAVRRNGDPGRAVDALNRHAFAARHGDVVQRLQLGHGRRARGRYRQLALGRETAQRSLPVAGNPQLPARVRAIQSHGIAAVHGHGTGRFQEPGLQRVARLQRKVGGSRDVSHRHGARAGGADLPIRLDIAQVDGAAAADGDGATAAHILGRHAAACLDADRTEGRHAIDRQGAVRGDLHIAIAARTADIDAPLAGDIRAARCAQVVQIHLAAPAHAQFRVAVRVGHADRLSTLYADGALGLQVAGRQRSCGNHGHAACARSVIQRDLPLPTHLKLGTGDQLLRPQVSASAYRQRTVARNRTQRDGLLAVHVQSPRRRQLARLEGAAGTHRQRIAAGRPQRDGLLAIHVDPSRRRQLVRLEGAARVHGQRLTAARRAKLDGLAARHQQRPPGIQQRGLYLAAALHREVSNAAGRRDLHRPAARDVHRPPPGGQFAGRHDPRALEAERAALDRGVAQRDFALRRHGDGRWRGQAAELAHAQA